MNVKKPVVRRGKRFEERQALIAKASAGDADAQSQMGDICREGDQLTAQDPPAAARWYRLAAEQGVADAQNNLGAMYQNGLGVPLDLAEAAKWYRLAADQKLPVAKCNLGVLLMRGWGVATDPEQGLRLLQEAAKDGDAGAQYKLGRTFLVGDGVPLDIGKSAGFFVMAARQRDPLARYQLGEMEPRLKELAMAGSRDAAWSLKEMYEAGLGVPKNRKESRHWGMLTATIGNVTDPNQWIEVLTSEGELACPAYDDFMRAARGDDRYSMEWLYQTGAKPDDLYLFVGRSLTAYRAKREAGMPPPSPGVWPTDDWRSWEPGPPSAQAPTIAKSGRTGPRKRRGTSAGKKVDG